MLLSQKSFILSSLLFYFSFCCSIWGWGGSIALPSHSLIPSLLYPACCWPPSTTFLSSVIVFFSSVISIWYFFNFLSLCWRSSVFIHFSCSVSILWTITFNSWSGRLIISISLRSFSEVLSYSFICNILLSLLVLLDSLCFCNILSKLATIPSLKGEAFCGRCPLGPRSTVLPATATRHSRPVCVGCTCLPDAAEGWMKFSPSLAVIHSCSLTVERAPSQHINQASRLEGMFQNDTCHANISRIDGDHKNGTQQCLCPQTKSQQFPASPAHA